MVKFSVVIPLYNGEKYIEGCLNSLIKQDFEDIEIIVIDDSSNDNSYRILSEIAKKDHRIKIYHNENNFGVSHTRNFGISVAKGEYIHFVDADDIVKPGLYTYMNEILKNDEYDFVRFDYDFLDNDNSYDNEEKIHIEERDIDKKYIHEKLIPYVLDEKLKAYVWQLIIKNNQLPKFNEKLKILEDELFCLEVFEKSSKAYLTKQSFYYYNIANNNSATRSLDNIKDMMKNMLIANHEIKSFLLSTKSKNNAYIKILDSRMVHSYSNYLEVLYIMNNYNYKKAVKDFEQVNSSENLKSIFFNMDYNMLSNKHKITSFLIINKHYFIIHIIYLLKRLNKYLKKGKKYSL